MIQTHPIFDVLRDLLHRTNSLTDLPLAPRGPILGLEW